MPDLFNTDINIINDKDFLDKIESTVVNNHLRVFFYLNTYSLYLINHNEKFRSAFLNSDYVCADGSSIKFAHYFLNSTNIQKVTFSHFFFSKLNEFLKEKKTRIYCVGSTETNITKAVSELKSKYTLNITGFKSGFFSDTESSSIIDEINNSRPELLLLGAGMPKSEIWIAENRDKFKVNCLITVGNFFDIVSGNIKLAPRILYNSGFEWIYRVLQEPKRLLPRYIKANSYFVYRLFKEIVRSKNKVNSYNNLLLL